MPKKLLLQSVQIGSPRNPNEGLRLGTVRFLPRGVRKEDYASRDMFDVWLPSLAPSRELLAKGRSGSLAVGRFAARYRAEMSRTEPAQIIKMLAELARRTPISVSCYCTDETRCHRSVLANLIREAAGEPRVAVYAAPHCIYTIAHPKKLAEALQSGCDEPWSEAKPWTSGRRLLQAAKNDGYFMPIVFGDSTDCSRLTHWGILESIELTDAGTEYTFSALREISGRHSPQELTLLSTGQKISKGFIRPYAICRTPKFLEH